MNFKSQVIAAAALLAVAGAAQAKLADISNGGLIGDSSLVFIAVDSVAKTSTVVDLGTTFKSFLPQGTTANVLIPADGSVASGFTAQSASPLTFTPGTTLTWNFATNTFTVNGVSQAALNGKTIDWAPFAGFASSTTTANTKWGVIAGGTSLYNTDTTLDVNGYGAQGPAFEIATTGPAGSAALLDSNRIAFAGGKVTNLFVNNSTVQTNGDASKAGASVRAQGQSGYLGNDNEFGLAGAWGNELAFSALNAVGASSSFYWTNEIPEDPIALTGTRSVTYAGQFAFSGSTLSYTVPGSVTPSVPEPESIALVLVGLAAIGFSARRKA